MKVRFTSSKEREPTVDGGLKVIYAPSKRIAFRLRWYLILLIVASPVLWFAGKVFSGMLLVEAPAHIILPSTELRALESGVIRHLSVKAGDEVAAGMLLVSLDNPVLRAQQRAITDTLQVKPLSTMLLQRQQQILSQQLERARLRSIELEQLVNIGAATRGELSEAFDALSDRQAALVEFEYRLNPTSDQQASSRRNLGELTVLSGRLEQLQILAGEDGIVRSVEVNEGESVGPGTLLMQLQTSGEVEIQVFLDARQRELAHPGQALKLRLPDGTWLAAQVASEPSIAARLPAGMRSTFAANELGLLVKVQPIEPLAQEWKLNNLPITARFPNQLQRWLE